MTGREAVAASLRKLGAIASGESLTADMASDGIAELNRMLQSWSTEEYMGVELSGVVLTLDDEIALGPGYDDCIIYNLTPRLAPEYGKAVSADIAAMALESKNNIKRLNTPKMVLECDEALMPLHDSVFNISTGEFE